MSWNVFLTLVLAPMHAKVRILLIFKNGGENEEMFMNIGEKQQDEITIMSQPVEVFYFMNLPSIALSRSIFCSSRLCMFLVASF